MSKQSKKLIIETITSDLIQKKYFDKDFIQIIKSYKLEYNEVDIINSVLKNMINNGYYIEKYNPLVIKEI